MSAPEIPPPLPPVKGRFQLLRNGTYIFLAFMVLVGLGLALTKTSSPALPGATPTIVAGRNPTLTPKAAPTVTPIPIPTPTPDTRIKVYILGEVEKPGVYTMLAGDRIEDAVKVAGGFTEQADPTRLDLAQRVEDEMQIIIPARPPTPIVTTGDTPTETVASGGITVPAKKPTATKASSSSGKSGSAPAAKTSVAPGKVNVNTGSQAELESLPGIGPVLAQRIIDYRSKNGPFKNLNDLEKVQGIGKGLTEKLKELVIF